GPLPITCLPGDPTIPCTGDVAGVALDDEFVILGGGCDGDSGLGAIEQSSFDRKQPMIVGVLARGNATEKNCYRDVLVRVDHWPNLLIRAAQLGAAFGGYPVPDWAAQLRPGGLGANCVANDDCASQRCESLDRGIKFSCTQPCDPTQATSCPDKYVCTTLPRLENGQEVGREDRCKPAPPPPPPSAPPPGHPGCAVARGHEMGEWMLVCVSGLPLLWRRLRKGARRAHRDCAPRARSN